MNPVIDNIRNRRSIRKYQDKGISNGIIEQIIGAGRYAPSSHNSQPWRFIAITDRKLIKELSEMMKQYYKRLLRLAPLLGFNKGLKKLADSVTKRVDSDKDLFFYDAPLLILVCAEPGGFHLVDCSCAAENMMLAARSLGIGSCWIGYADRAFGSRKFRDKVGVPKGLKVMASIVFGYPLKFPENAYPRKEEDVVRWVK